MATDNVVPFPTRPKHDTDCLDVVRSMSDDELLPAAQTALHLVQRHGRDPGKAGAVAAALEMAALCSFRLWNVRRLRP